MRTAATIASVFSDRITTRCFPASEAIDEGIVEPGILKLVAALNVVHGVETIAS